MNGLYGPRTEEVERFLERLGRLTPGQLRRVVRNGAASPDHVGKAEAVRAADTAALRHGRNAGLDAAADAARRYVPLAIFPEGPEAFHLARLAAAALALADLITWPQFATLYGPFFQLIPPGSLRRPTDFGPGTAQVTHFLRKVRKLTQSQWYGVIGLYQQRVSAHIPTPDSLRTACEAAQVEAGVMAGRSWDRAMPKAPRSVPGREMAEQAARDAVRGLVVKNGISPDCFTVLYAPFAPIIPVEALTSRGAFLRFLHTAGQRLEGPPLRYNLRP